MRETKDSSAPAASVQGVRKTYRMATGAVEALRGLDLTIEPGEFVAVMGASGSGKSTLLHILGGLDRPTAGTVRVGGQNLETLSDRQLTVLRRRHVGMVFQFFNLVATLTALENVVLPMAIDGADRERMARRGAELLAAVGLAHRADHHPDALSGGEQQRVAIARALLMDPQIVLADEPTGNLDSTTAQTVWTLLADLARRMNKALCVVTHESAVGAHADRILALKDGRIVGGFDTAEIGHDPSLVAARYQKLTT